MPPAQTIQKKLGRTWNEVLALCGLPSPLDRDTLSRLSNALHLLEKRIVNTLGLGWDEKSFVITGYDRKMRPDSSCVERMYLRDSQLLVLDVKLSICSSPLTIYKYLPIFEHPTVPQQMTFFPEWIAEDTLGDVPGVQIDSAGQLNFFSTNNILYICYLVGKPQKNFLSGEEIAGGRGNFKKKKHIPKNMEVRFIEFPDLPKLYCRIAGVEYDKSAVRSFLKMAGRIKDVVLSLPENARKMSWEIFRQVKREP